MPQLQTTDNLISLTGELRRDALIGDHSELGRDVSASASAHEAAARAGDARLNLVAAEMQAHLEELEASYYGCSVRGEQCAPVSGDAAGSGG